MDGKRIYKFIGPWVLAICLPGCIVTQPQKVPHQPVRLTDSELNRDYFVYRPSAYGKFPMPLVVTCHGTNPWDSAQMQINEWKYLAETNNFVVIAPVINSARGFIPPGPPEGTNILKDDERFILKIIQPYLTSPNIDNRATMITGWSAGGFATYYVGLRHPEIFRVVVARQCNFVQEYYPEEARRANPYQPVLIFYGKGDLPILKADSQVAYRFLKDAGHKNLFVLGLDGGHSRRPEVALDFFNNAIKMYPSPKIMSARLFNDGSCRIRFGAGIVGASSGDERIFWDFGDGDSGPGNIVDHRYNRPGRYRLAVMHNYKDQVLRFTGIIDIQRGSLAIKPGVKK